MLPATDPTSAAAAPAKNSKKKGWIIGGSIVAGVIVIGSVADALGGTSKDTIADDQHASIADHVVEEEPAPAAEPPAKVNVPEVAGLTAADAVSALTAAGFLTSDISTFDDPTAKVVSSDPPAGTSVQEGSGIRLTVEEKPKFSLAQQNAINKAQSYLSMTGFSRIGLIKQLEFEGYSNADATFGTDNAGADWNAECAEKAKSYLDMTSFSRDGLATQLAFEGFAQSEIDFGLQAVGY